MTTDLFPEPQIVRAHVRSGDQLFTSQVPLVGMEWADAEIAIRKFSVRKAKALLVMKGVLCASCGEMFEANPPPCPACSPVRVVLWDGRAEYPITDDMMRVYPPATRFNVVAMLPGRPTAYAAQELRGPDWIGLSMEERQRVMGRLVDELLRFYPDVAREAVRTLITDGKREMPYPANWLAVLGDQAG